MESVNVGRLKHWGMMEERRDLAVMLDIKDKISRFKELSQSKKKIVWRCQL